MLHANKSCNQQPVLYKRKTTDARRLQDEWSAQQKSRLKEFFSELLLQTQQIIIGENTSSHFNIIATLLCVAMCCRKEPRTLSLREYEARELADFPSTSIVYT
jgi:hypothetical protein